MAGINNYSTLMDNSNRNMQFDDVDNETEINDVPKSVSTTSLHIQRPQHSFDDREKLIVESLNADQDLVTNFKYMSSEGDLSLPLDKHQLPYHDDSTEIFIRKYLCFGVQWVSLVTENLLSHPFIVLRRQCQVYNASQSYHLHPFDLLASIVHLHRRQGVTTLWKGLGSCLLVRGMSLAIDDIISKFTTWPKAVDSCTTLKSFGQHILLKCISIGLVMPFYAASLVETVQSDIASEKPGLLDVFREGSLRLFYWSSPQKGRLLPAWALVVPSVSLGITKYLFNLVIKGISARIVRRRLAQAQEVAKLKDDTLEYQNAEIYANLIATVTTEVIFFPFETIIYRIQLQGTRTIIDNLDNGYAVVPILTNYHGAIDCYRTTIAAEGFAGLYKGFGALILQFAAHVAVIKLTKWVVNQIAEIISNQPPPCITQFYNLDRALPYSNSNTISPSVSSCDLDHQSLD